MPTLVILLAVRPPTSDATVVDPPPADWPYVLSPDGVAIGRQGTAALGELPRADTVVAVVPASRLSWHHPVLPKAPAGRLRAALGGLLEEQLLDDPEALHLALAPRATAGKPVWVAAVGRAWLSAQLNTLQAAGLTIDRVVPSQAPTDNPDLPPTVHFYRAEGDTETACCLAAADADGVACLPLAGGLARALLPRWQAAGARFSATPAAATAAERWLAAPIEVMTEAQHALVAAGSDWNLLQFDLAPRHRGTRALASWGRHWQSSAWRPVRWGVAALLVVQVLGLNLWAWHLQRSADGRRDAMASLLRASHPQVRAVLDAPLQMKRETDALREAAGVPGEADLEPLLAAAAAAWPDGQPPAVQLQYEPGRLGLAAVGWPTPQIDQLRQRLQPGGWALDSADGRLTISRAAALASP